MMEMFLFMQKILLWACICLSFTITLSTYADPTTDITNSHFMVDLSKMDPLAGSHDSPSSPPGGIQAFQAGLGKLTNILLILIPIIASVSMLIAGYFYIFSAGDSEKAGRAKTIIKWNIMAISVAFLSLGIVKIVASFFNH